MSALLRESGERVRLGADVLKMVFAGVCERLADSPGAVVGNRRYTSVMDRAAKEHVDELLKLPVEERSAAAEALLLSLEDSIDEVGADEAWSKEIERRIVENAPGIPAETVFAEGRARLNAKP